MSRNKELLICRNEAIRKAFQHHRRKNPKWTIYAVIDETAKDFFLSQATITKILKGKGEDVPEHVTVIRHCNATK
jgi:hypothetical protein